MYVHKYPIRGYYNTLGIFCYKKPSNHNGNKLKKYYKINKKFKYNIQVIKNMKKKFKNMKKQINKL